MLVTMRTTLALLFLAGCSTAASPVEVDAAAADAAHVEDVGHAEIDAHAPDAPELDAFTLDAYEADAPAAACDLVTNAGCTATTTCRPTPGAHTQFDGPVECLDDGTGIVAEGDSGCPAMDCAHGLFCETNTACVRPCDPAGTLCPPLHGTAQGCGRDGDGDIYHCSTRF